MGRREYVCTCIGRERTSYTGWVGSNSSAIDSNVAAEEAEERVLGFLLLESRLNLGFEDWNEEGFGPFVAIELLKGVLGTGFEAEEKGGVSAEGWKEQQLLGCIANGSIFREREREIVVIYPLREIYL